MKLEENVYREPPTCSLCEQGFPRRGGIHIPTQRLGMIPNTPCRMAEAVHLGKSTDSNRLPWIAYVSGRRVFSEGRASRPARFGSEESARRAALKLLEDTR